VKLPPLKAMSALQLRPLMRNERRIELAFEGTRLWDLFRWEIAEEVLKGDFWGAPFPNSPLLPRISRKQDQERRWFVTSKNFRKQDYVWPIPQSEINVNPKLAQ